MLPRGPRRHASRSVGVDPDIRRIDLFDVRAPGDLDHFPIGPAFRPESLLLTVPGPEKGFRRPKMAKQIGRIDFFGAPRCLGQLPGVEQGDWLSLFRNAAPYIACYQRGALAVGGRSPSPQWR